MAVRNRSKMKENGSLQNYISYFQSVMTVGIVSKAHTLLEAEKASKRKFTNSDLSCGIVAQTPFEIAETEQWKPDFVGCIMPIDDEAANMMFGFNEQTRQRIALKLNKGELDITDDDCIAFVKSAVELSLTS